MNILTLKYRDKDYEIVEDFPDQMMLLRQIIGDLPTDEQLKAVKHYIGEGEGEMRDMISGAFLAGNLSGDEDDFQSNMRFTLLEAQFPLGEQVTVLRGAAGSNQL